MPIQLDAGQLAAINLSEFEYEYLIEFETGATIKRFTTASDDIIFQSNIFKSDGSILAISDFEFNSTISFQTSKIELSIANILNINYFFDAISNRAITIWVIIQNTTPILVTRGLIESAKLDGEKLTLEIENYYSNFQEDGFGRFHTLASQQRYYPTDLSFQWVEKLSTKNLIWGNPNDR